MDILHCRQILYHLNLQGSPAVILPPPKCQANDINPFLIIWTESCKEPHSYRVIWGKDPKPSWLWDLRPILEEILIVKAVVFPVVIYRWLWELDHKEGWILKNWCFQFVVLEKTLESPLDSKEIKPVNLKGNQPWMFSGRTDAEAEAPVNTVTTWCEELTHWERPWSWERLKAGGGEGAEDEMVGWHHQLNGHGFGWTPGVGDGQGGLVCYGLWDRTESDTTE